MELKLQVDSAHLRSVMSDLTGRRRGQVTKLSQDKHIKLVDAKAPLKVSDSPSYQSLPPFSNIVFMQEMQGYSTDMRSFTKGTGFYSMEFLDYEAPAESVQREILQEHGYFDIL